jgi:hypothetical protein
MDEWPAKDPDGPPQKFDVRRLAWLISGHDFRIHAFYDVNPGLGYIEALCEHSVPPDRLVNPADTALAPERCMKCQLILGDLLADLLGDDTDWSR